MSCCLHYRRVKARHLQGYRVCNQTEHTKQFLVAYLKLLKANKPGKIKLSCLLRSTKLQMM